MIDTASDSRPSTAAFHLLVPYSFFLWCAGQRHDGGLENQGWGQIALGGCNTSRGATHVPPALLERPYLASVGACSRARVARRAACTFLLRAPHGEKSAALLQGATAGRCCHGTARSSSRGGLRDHLWWRVFLVLGARRAPLHRRARSAARCSDDRRVLCLGGVVCLLPRWSTRAWLARVRRAPRGGAPRGAGARTRPRTRPPRSST